MLPAFVDLVIDARKSSPAHAVLTVVIVDRQCRISCLIVFFLYAVARNAPDRVFPVLLVLERYVCKRLLELVYFCNILNALKR